MKARGYARLISAVMTKQVTIMSDTLSNSSTNDNQNSGSTHAFDNNWKHRAEAHYNHWVKGEPTNQIQLAFHSHWQVFSDILRTRGIDTGSVLEVGCGRGSLSSHFADNGWACTLLDYSPSVLDIAQSIFTHNQHNAEFVTGDARNLPFEDNSFDVVTSIGLLEHFDDIATPIREQYRILKPGGVFLGYIVPERPDNVQRYFNWVNAIARAGYRLFSNTSESAIKKEDIYRSDHYSPRYLDVISRLDVAAVESMGLYPLPMISHSPEFPFSLMPKPLEKALTTLFKGALRLRHTLYKRHGWICSEQMGQAFLVVFTKQ